MSHAAHELNGLRFAQANRDDEGTDQHIRPRQMTEETTMQHEMSRRDLIRRALLASTFVPALGLIARESRAADLTPLDLSDPTAKALGYVADAAHVDASANPNFKTGQHCANCAQYQGKPTDATAGCTIFPGHSVPAGGWCKVWMQRPG